MSQSTTLIQEKPSPAQGVISSSDNPVASPAIAKAFSLIVTVRSCWNVDNTSKEVTKLKVVVNGLGIDVLDHSPLSLLIDPAKCPDSKARSTLFVSVYVFTLPINASPSEFTEANSTACLHIPLSECPANSNGILRIMVPADSPFLPETHELMVARIKKYSAVHITKNCNFISVTNAGVSSVSRHDSKGNERDILLGSAYPGRDPLDCRSALGSNISGFAANRSVYLGLKQFDAASSVQFSGHRGGVLGTSHDTRDNLKSLQGSISASKFMSNTNSSHLGLTSLRDQLHDIENGAEKEYSGVNRGTLSSIGIGGAIRKKSVVGMPLGYPSAGSALNGYPQVQEANGGNKNNVCELNPEDSASCVSPPLFANKDYMAGEDFQHRGKIYSTINGSFGFNLRDNPGLLKQYQESGNRNLQNSASQLSPTGSKYLGSDIGTLLPYLDDLKQQMSRLDYRIAAGRTSRKSNYEALQGYIHRREHINNCFLAKIFLKNLSIAVLQKKLSQAKKGTSSAMSNAPSLLQSRETQILEGELLALKERLKKSGRDLSEMKKKYLALREGLTCSQEEASKLKAALVLAEATSKQQKEAHEVENSRLSNKLISCEAELKEVAVEKDSLKANFSEMKGRYAVLKEQLGISNETIEKLRAENLLLKSQICSGSHIREQVWGQNDTLQEEVARFQRSTKYGGAAGYILPLNGDSSPPPLPKDTVADPIDSNVVADPSGGSASTFLQQSVANVASPACTMRVLNAVHPVISAVPTRASEYLQEEQN